MTPALATLAHKVGPWLRARGLALLFIAVGLLQIHAHRWLLDDAFIYFRYVDNWLFLDRGLVFNPGEYVEGYSSQVWPLVLAPARSLGLSYWLVVEALGLLIGGLFFLAAVRINRRLTPAGIEPRLELPLAILAVSYAPTTYFTGGLETPLVQLFAAVVALFVLEPQRRLTAAAVAFAPVVRPELALALALALVAVRVRTGRWPWPTMVLTGLVGLGALGFRVWYYADLFPTTYYLKHTRDWAAGLSYAWDAVRGMQLHIIAPAVILVELWARRRAGAEPPPLASARRWLLGIALVTCLYPVHIGGDMVHYRMLAFPLCLGVLALGGLAERWAAGRRFAPLGVLAVAAALFSAVPPYLSAHPLSEQSERVMGHYQVSEAIAHRRVTSQRYHPDRIFEEAQQLYTYHKIRRGKRRPEPPMSDRACVVAYYYSWVVFVHAYGLTEPALARADAPVVRAGHRNLPLAARDLQQLRANAPAPWGPGSYRAAVEAGEAPQWVEDNLEALEALEARVYNQHHLLTNLRLAFGPQPKIELTDRERDYVSIWH